MYRIEKYKNRTWDFECTATNRKSAEDAAREVSDGFLTRVVYENTTSSKYTRNGQSHYRSVRLVFANNRIVWNSKVDKKPFPVF